MNITESNALSTYSTAAHFVFFMVHFEHMG